jgi:hypothetical protein
LRGRRRGSVHDLCRSKRCLIDISDTGNGEIRQIADGVAVVVLRWPLLWLPPTLAATEKALISLQFS